MSQVVRRRYTRQIKEDASLPDLIMIDGGKGQMSVAQKELDELDVMMAVLLDQAIAIEKESQRLLDLAEKMQKGNEDF